MLFLYYAVQPFKLCVCVSALFLGDGGGLRLLPSLLLLLLLNMLMLNACLYPNMSNFPIVGIVLAYNGGPGLDVLLFVNSNTPEKERNMKIMPNERNYYSYNNNDIQWKWKWK